MNMVKLYDGGVYLVNGTEIVPEAAAPETYQKDTAKQGTIAYSILKAHNTAEDMQNFYSQLPKRLESVIWLEQSGKPGYEQAQAIAQKKFDAVQKPFTYSFGVSPDAMDYQTLLSLLLTLLLSLIHI